MAEDRKDIPFDVDADNLRTVRRRMERFTFVPAAPPDAELFSVVAVDETHVLATFAAAVLDNDALRCVDVYHFTPELTVSEIEPVGDPPTAVLITVNEMLDDESYTLLIDVLEPAED